MCLGTASKKGGNNSRRPCSAESKRDGELISFDWTGEEEEARGRSVLRHDAIADGIARTNREGPAWENAMVAMTETMVRRGT